MYYKQLRLSPVQRKPFLLRNTEVSRTTGVLRILSCGGLFVSLPHPCVDPLK